MTEPIKILVVLDSGVEPELIQTVLAIEPEVQILAMADSLHQDWGRTAEESADILVVACSGYSDRVLHFISAATAEHAERPLVVLSEGAANGFVRRVFEAGADDIVSLPDSPSAHVNGALAEEIVFTLQKALARKRGSMATLRDALGTLVCVLGPKGGIGKTLTATNLAVALAEEGERTAIVDLDLQFGDVALAVGLAPERTIYDLATSSGALDAEKIEAYMAQHDSGVYALLAPIRPDQASAVTVEFLREVYELLRGSYDYVVVDTPPGFTPEVIASIDASSHVCMVGTLDSLSLKNTKLGIETLDLMGYDQSRVSVVLNRADSRVGITREDVAEIVGRPPDVLVPSHRDIARSVNQGAPIVLSGKRSEAARAFADLAGLYITNRSHALAPAANGAADANGRHNGKPRKRRSRRLLGRRG
ncbi:MAG TPA: AAA family ATPase [Thermoleophilaceae bacterium]